MLYFKISIIVFLLVFISCSENRDDQVLARVGDTEIKSSEYMERLKQVREKLELPDNGEVRRNFLSSFIDEQLLLLEAKNLGFDSDSAAIRKLRSIKLQKLLDSYLQQKVYDNVDLSDNALKDYFFKMNTKLHVKHLFADTREKADSLYSLVQKGESFEKLAKNIFRDPLLQKTGGDLGYLGFDEMQQDFAQAGYLLKKGEISTPVKTNYGYSIIQVVDRLGNPLLTENEFLKQKSKIMESYSKYAAKKAAKLHANTIQEEIRVNINEDVFEKLYTFFQEEMKNSNLVESKIHKSVVSDDAILLTSQNGNWSVKTFKEKAEFTTDAQRSWIRNRENFRDYIKGLVARDFIEQQAINSGFNETNDYKTAVREKFQKFQIDRVKEDILSSIHVSDDSLENYYLKNKAAFTIPAAINLREIVVENPEKAAEVKALLNQGKEFSGLARLYSVNKKTAVQGGETGFISMNQFGKLADKIGKLKSGEWTGPIRNGELFYFVQCIENRKSTILAFEGVKIQVLEMYRNEYFDTAMSVRLAELRAETPIVSYPQKLKSLKYN